MPGRLVIAETARRKTTSPPFSKSRSSLTFDRYLVARIYSFEDAVRFLPDRPDGKHVNGSLPQEQRDSKQAFDPFTRSRDGLMSATACEAQSDIRGSLQSSGDGQRAPALL
jgi:hypothetical protein